MAARRSARAGAFIWRPPASALPGGTYRIASGLPEDRAEEEALGWLLSAYAFDRYRSQTRNPARLVAPAKVWMPRGSR